MSATSNMPSALGRKSTKVCLCLGSGDDNPGVSTIIVEDGTLLDVSKRVTTCASAKASFLRVLKSETSTRAPSALITSALHTSAPK